MADKRDELDQAHQFLGYTKAAPSTDRVKPVRPIDGSEDDEMNQNQADDAERHAGSRDVDEGGGVASEVGGTRNYHHSGGATGGDLGNRPE